MNFGSTTDPETATAILENWEGLGAAAIDSAVKGSLARLGIDRIDLYYAHIVDLVGCSNMTSWRLERARQLAADQDVARYSVVQPRYTYLWPNPPAQDCRRLGSPHFRHIGIEHLDYLNEHRDVTLVAYAALLSGSYGRPERPFPAELGYAHPTAYARFEVLRQVAQELGATLNQVVLAWLLHQDPVVIPLFGASSVGQLDEALDAVEISLDAELMDRLTNA